MLQVMAWQRRDAASNVYTHGSIAVPLAHEEQLAVVAPVEEHLLHIPALLDLQQRNMGRR
jgi:hypothetical protein